MTTTLKCEEFVSNSGTLLFIEKYTCPLWKREFWRYGDIILWHDLKYHRVLKGGLLSRPNKKRLIQTL